MNRIAEERFAEASGWRDLAITEELTNEQIDAWKRSLDLLLAELKGVSRALDAIEVVGSSKVAAENARVTVAFERYEMLAEAWLHTSRKFTAAVRRETAEKERQLFEVERQMSPAQRESFEASMSPAQRERYEALRAARTEGQR